MARLEAGADHTVQSGVGMTALMFAVRGSNADVARILIAHGADATVKDKRGQTALVFASMGGYVSMIDVLLTSGATLEELDAPKAIKVAKSKKLTEFVSALESKMMG